MADDAKQVFRILLAEDIKLNQMLTRKLLGRSGYHIDVVENGREAVEAISRAEYDVVLMDVEMPEVDGIEATRRIRGLPPPKCQVPIIALTAHAMDNAEKYFVAVGMNDYISKPINFDILFTKLSALAKARDT